MSLDKLNKRKNFMISILGFLDLSSQLLYDMGMVIQSAEIQLNMPQILNIFPKVENKLLDILRYLENQFGNLDELDIDVNNKSEQELKEIVNHIYVLIYNDQSVTIGNDNEFNNSNIASSIKTEN